MNRDPNHSTTPTHHAEARASADSPVQQEGRAVEVSKTTVAIRAGAGAVLGIVEQRISSATRFRGARKNPVTSRKRHGADQSSGPADLGSWAVPVVSASMIRPPFSSSP